MTVITKKPENPTVHLTAADVEQLGVELDAIRQEVLDTRGARDARLPPTVRVRRPAVQTDVPRHDGLALAAPTD